MSQELKQHGLALCDVKASAIQTLTDAAHLHGEEHGINSGKGIRVPDNVPSEFPMEDYSYFRYVEEIQVDGLIATDGVKHTFNVLDVSILCDLADWVDEKYNSK